MWVHEIWRYPVKSMAGESLDRADLTAQGVAGDRILQVRSSDGQIVTARTRPALLGYRATSGPDGEPRVDGQPWRSGDIALAVEAAAGKGARLVESEPENRFDILPLLVATDGMLASSEADSWRSPATREPLPLGTHQSRAVPMLPNWPISIQQRAYR